MDGSPSSRSPINNTQLPPSDSPSPSHQARPKQPNHTHSTLNIAFPSHWAQASSRHLPLFSQPTRIRFQAQDDGEYRWSSRAHRKGRRPTPVSDDAKKKKDEEGRAVRTRFWGWDFGDISWWVAMLFLVGSVFWCANGVLVFCFSSLSTTPILASEAATAFIGGTLFWFGAYLSFVEALNPARDARFGEEVESELGLGGGAVGRGWVGSASTSGTAGVMGREKVKMVGRGGGGLARSGGRSGTSPTWVSVLCGLPGVLPDAGSEASDGLPARNLGLWEGLYWVPQILGSPGFIISGAMFSIEVQKKWYRPKFNTR
ncbi:hypothetical protein FRB90_003134 [Tulasnella sp. 427]|nr:hypothetical protein FRB90_003134 [Tulasnella sp. 427]